MSPIPSGSEPARDEGDTVDITINRPTANASRLAPTEEVVDNLRLLDFLRTLPAVDVALAGASDGQLSVIHILRNG